MPLSVVKELDELRSAAGGWLAAASLSGLVATGIVVNWLTESPWKPSTAAIIVLAVFATIAALSLAGSSSCGAAGVEVRDQPVAACLVLQVGGQCPGVA